jgi:hypothetical protein
MKILAGRVRVHSLSRELLQVRKFKVLQALNDVADGVHQTGLLYSGGYKVMWSHGGNLLCPHRRLAEIIILAIKGGNRFLMNSGLTWVAASMRAAASSG